MLHVTISVAAAPGPSPLRDHIAETRELGELVDFAVVPVRPTDADRGGGSGAAGGNGGRGGHSRDVTDPTGTAGYEPGLAAAADPGAAELEPFLPGGSACLLASSEASGAAGEITEAPADLGHGVVRLVFLGIGDGSVRALRRAGAVVGRRAAGGRTAVVNLPADASADAVQAFAEGVLLGSYRYVFAPDGGPAAAQQLAVSAGSAAPGVPAVCLVCLPGHARRPSVVRRQDPPHQTGHGAQRSRSAACYGTG